jgi:YD repeat-containing protein
VKEADGNTTQYRYDAHGNLTCVNIAGQYRAFEYDSLTKACNPGWALRIAPRLRSRLRDSKSTPATETGTC